MSDAADSRKAKFVEDLLTYMTPEEKLGQLRILRLEDEDRIGESDIPEDVFALIRAGRVSAVRGVISGAEASELQRCAVEQSRYGVPLLLEGGPEGDGHGDWPQPLAMAATWDSAAIARLGRAVSMSARAAGANWIAAPALKLSVGNADCIEETLGSSPLLARKLVSAMIDGLGTALHDGDCPSLPSLSFPAEREEQRLGVDQFVREVTRGSGAVAIDSRNWAGSDAPLQAPGFSGIDFARWQTITRFTAGEELDEQIAELAGRLEADRAFAAQVDDAVRSVLRAKIGMGLFRDPFAGFVQTDAGRTKLALAQRTAREEIVRRSAVLLRNTDGILPLSTDSGRVLVTGGHASELGTVCKALDEFGIAYRAVTGLAMREDGSGSGEAIPADGLAIGLACDAAGRADTVLVAVGDSDCSRAEEGGSPRLSRPAQTLLRGITNANPRVVLVELTSVPVDLGALAPLVKGRLLAWNDLAGRESALGDLLSGEAGPSGRLPVALDSAVEEAAFAFGHGLGFASPAYSSPAVEYGADRLLVHFSLINSEGHDVLETAQLYLRRPGRDGLHLAAYDRVKVPAETTLPVRFELGIEEIGILGSDGRFAAHAGVYTIHVGRSAAELSSRDVELPASLLRAMALAGGSHRSRETGTRLSA